MHMKRGAKRRKICQRLRKMTEKKEKDFFFDSFGGEKCQYLHISRVFVNKTFQCFLLRYNHPFFPLALHKSYRSKLSKTIWGVQPKHMNIGTSEHHPTYPHTHTHIPNQTHQNLTINSNDLQRHTRSNTAWMGINKVPES